LSRLKFKTGALKFKNESNNVLWWLFCINIFCAAGMQFMWELSWI
jgi:hypothetical protein